MIPRAYGIKIHPNPSCFILIGLLLAKQKEPNLLQSLIGDRGAGDSSTESGWNRYLTRDLPKESIHAALKIEKSLGRGEYNIYISLKKTMHKF